MIVQWCIKGLAFTEDESMTADEQAQLVIDSRQGLLCNWWRDVDAITPAGRREKLTETNLDRHVNQFGDTDPVTGEPFSKQTPFISLSGGTIERDAAAKTNYVRSAHQTALWFGTQFGRLREAYLYTCFVVVAPRQAVELEGVAEEIRDLNTYRRYSDYQTEGEFAAKILVPDNQIRSCEKWELQPDMFGPPGAVERFERAWTYENPRFSDPHVLSNVREMI